MDERKILQYALQAVNDRIHSATDSWIQMCGSRNKRLIEFYDKLLDELYDERDYIKQKMERV